MNVDPILVFLLIVTFALWGWAGFEICQATHKQRGLESDPLSHVLPPLPPDVVVPDTPKDLEESNR